MEYPVNYTQLTWYLVFTILSIVVSMAAYVYLMSFSDISKYDREQFNVTVYNFLAEREQHKSTSQSDDKNLSQKLM